MSKLSGIITTLALLKGSGKLSPVERSAVGCAIQLAYEIERLGITIDTLGKDFYYVTHPSKTKGGR